MPSTATAGRTSFLPFCCNQAAARNAMNAGIPLFQAFSPIPVQRSTYCDCIKDGQKIEHADGTGVILLFNEGRERYTGRIEIYRNEHNANPGTVEHAMTKEGVEDRKKYTIDAWNSKIYDAEEVPDVDLETMKGMVIVLIDKDKDVRSNQYTAVFDYCNNSWLGINTMNKAGSGEQPLYRRRILNADSLIANHARVITCENKWTRSICRSIFYPDFVEPEEIELPDNLASEKPEFSGFVRYDNFFVADTERYNRFFLEISDAYEGVEVFVNNKTLGIQVTPHLFI